MNFQFLPKQSKIFDFLQFPKMLFHKEFFLESSSLNNYKEALDESYFERLDAYKALLSPYAKDIQLFYVKNYSDVEFTDFLTKNVPICHYDSIASYLDYLRTLDEATIKAYMIATLNLEREDDTKALTVNATSEEITHFLESFSLESPAKWNLFMQLQDPLKHLHHYITLLDALLPIFEEIYSNYEAVVESYGQHVQEYLNTHGESGLEEMSNSLINQNFLLNEENTLLVSALFAYTIMVSDGPLNNQIIWGLKVESALKKIKAINVDKLNERVQTFKYLGDKTKYEVLKHISNGITSTKEIARLTGVSSATISYHINGFLTAKIIKLDNTNRKFSYVINYALLDEIIKDFKIDLNFDR